MWAREWRNNFGAILPNMCKLFGHWLLPRWWLLKEPFFFVGVSINPRGRWWGLKSAHRSRYLVPRFFFASLQNDCVGYDNPEQSPWSSFSIALEGASRPLALTSLRLPSCSLGGRDSSHPPTRHLLSTGLDHYP